MTTDAVRAEQIKTLYRQSPWISAINPINAAVVGAVLWSPAHRALIVGWVLANALGALVRVLLRRRYWRQVVPVQQAPAWGRRYTAVMAVAGLLWGVGSVLLYSPQAPVANLILFFVVGGMAAGAAGTLAYHIPAFSSYAALAIVPLSIRILAEGGRLHVAMGILGIVFGAALAIIATNTHRAVSDSFRLRFANEHLLARLSQSQLFLEEANRTLEQRVEERSRQLQGQTAALEEARRMESLGLLVGGVAHDFNNLLTVVLGNVAILSERPTMVAEGGDALGAIRQASERAAWLVGQLLASSRRQVRTARVLDLNDVVSSAHKLLSRLIGEHVELIVALHASPLPIEADPRQLEQVIVNLTTNARDALIGGGRITIETDSVKIDSPHPGTYAVLSVRDTGVGMDAETRRMAFYPFFTTKEVGHGTGLGLATVNGIVEQSGGHILLESEPGKGSCFRVFLPRAQAPLSAEVAPAVSKAPARKATVLLVEDEAMVLAIVSRALGVAGLSVLEAESGEQALERARRHDGPIDLLVTDVVMAKMSGPELAQRLKEERPDVRVLFVSGYRRDLAVPSPDLAAGIDFLEKPFTPSAILDRVSRLLAVDCPLAPGAAISGTSCAAEPSPPSCEPPRGRSR